jgi:NAD-dependent dihydropyrimidine dehydrogenase PreA subunit
MCLSDYRELAKILSAPPMFTDVLPLLVTPDEIEILLELSDTTGKTINDVSASLHRPQNNVESIIHGLFIKGFLKKTSDEETQYSLKSFRSMVSRYLSEGKKELLGDYVAALAKYRMDEHVRRANAVPHPKSRIVPIPEAITKPASIVLPYETAMTIVEDARSFSIRDCECRMTYSLCDNPVRTCLALNDLSEEFIDRGVSEKISLDEARQILTIANEHGLVHQVIYADWLKGEVRDMCSCCPCCCTYLRTVLEHGVTHHIAKSGLVATVEDDKCNGCGICLDRCVFKARKLENRHSIVVEDHCYGCGLCITTCPTRASNLVS